MNLEATEIPIAFAVLPKRLKLALPPFLCELVKVPGDGTAGFYRIKVLRADRDVGTDPVSDMPFITFYGENLPKMHARIRDRWRKCTGGQELPEDAFKEVE